MPNLSLIIFFNATLESNTKLVSFCDFGGTFNTTPVSSIILPVIGLYQGISNPSNTATDVIVSALYVDAFFLNSELSVLSNLDNLLF